MADRADREAWLRRRGLTGGPDTVVFGVSCDSFFSHKAWADSMDLKHRLLSDVHRTTAKGYGLYFEPLNCSKRTA